MLTVRLFSRRCILFSGNNLTAGNLLANEAALAVEMQFSGYQAKTTIVH